MKKWLLAGIALSSLAFPALAADMKVKAPILKAPPPVVYRWTGCYVGGNFGWKHGRFRESVDTPAGVAVIPGLANSPFTAGHTDLGGGDSDSWAAGGQIGCRWESKDHWVVGVEGDLDATNLRRTAVVAPPLTPGVGVIIPGDFFQNRDRWEASARLVLGHTWDRVFLYGTGGVAFTRVDMNATFIAAIVNGIPFPASAGGDSQTLVGYTVGAGGAYALDKNWSLGAEYRFSSYGSKDFALGNVAAVCGFTTAVPGPGPVCVNTTATGHKDLQTHEILVKLNYQFGGPAAVTTKY